MWHVTHDAWNFTLDTWHVMPDNCPKFFKLNCIFVLLCYCDTIRIGWEIYCLPCITFLLLLSWIFFLPHILWTIWVRIGWEIYCLPCITFLLFLSWIFVLAYIFWTIRVLVLLSAHVKRFSVSRMQDFFFFSPSLKLLKSILSNIKDFWLHFFGGCCFQLWA